MRGPRPRANSIKNHTRKDKKGEEDRKKRKVIIVKQEGEGGRKEGI